MNFDVAINIAIGLMLMYLVLSLVCTVFNEYISQILAWRSKTLAGGIERLIDVPQLRADFYNHGLMDMTRAASDGKHPSYVSGRTFASALLGSLDPTKPLPAFQDVESAVRTLPDSNIRDMLLSHVLTADNNLTHLRDDLASGFDAAMDRLSGVYKRKLRWCSAIIGLLVAVALNADTCAVTQALWKDSSLRAELVASAPALIKQANQSGSADLAALQEQLRPLPIGWHAQSSDSTTDASSRNHTKDTATRGPILTVLSKIAGLLITGLALSLGAPFWFDLLSKFVQIRATGGKPEKGT